MISSHVAVGASESTGKDVKPSMAEPQPVVTVNSVVEPPNPAEANVEPTLDESEAAPFKPNLPFYLILLSLASCVWLGGIDLSSLSPALPTIIASLPSSSSSFVWVSSAYTIASTAVLPLAGNLANIWGRKGVLLGFLGVFAVGSAVTGAARDMTTAIAGRTVQGLGGGGLLALSNIIIADLVPLRQRGTYVSLLAVVWAITSVVGPPIGGALAQNGNWRWLFWMNMPVCAGAGGMVLIFLKLKRPGGSWRTGMRRMDWIGNIILIAAAASCMLALTQGGLAYPWQSFQTLLPLLLGLLGLGLFLGYEFLLPHLPSLRSLSSSNLPSTCISTEPLVPLSLLASRTALAGYAGSFIHGITSLLLIYYLPVFFQACLLSSPLQSSIQLLPTALTIPPLAILGGISVSLTNHYRLQNILPWCFCILGFGLLSTLSPSSSPATWASYQIIASLGLGVLWISTQFPVLAPLKPEQNAHALAFLSFVHSGANTLGVTIGAAVLQNELRRLLPPAFAALFPEGADIAYSAIPQIASLPHPLQDEVRQAFAQALSTVWKVGCGVSALGLLSTAGMRQLKMGGTVAEEWGREEGKREERVPLAEAERQAIDEAAGEVQVGREAETAATGIGAEARGLV